MKQTRLQALNHLNLYIFEIEFRSPVITFRRYETRHCWGHKSAPDLRISSPLRTFPVIHKTSFFAGPHISKPQIVCEDATIRRGGETNQKLDGKSDGSGKLLDLQLSIDWMFGGFTVWKAALQVKQGE